MKFSIRYADKIVGALVILALAILVIVIFMLGKNQRWFVKDNQYITYLNSASGVSRNMPVQYKGFRIGEIKEIELAKDDRVEITFSIYKEHDHRVLYGSLVEVQSSPIPGLGNAFVFHPGTGKGLIENGSIIPEVNSREGRDVISEGFSTVAKADDSITNILNQVTGILETVNLALSGPKESNEVPLEQIIKNLSGVIEDIKVVTGTLSENLEPLINSLEEIASMIADPDSAISSILKSDGPIYSNLEGAITSLADVIENLNKTSEFLPEQLPQISVTINELNMTIKSVQDILTAVANNPLLKGGIPEHKETGPSSAGSRNQDFIKSGN
jgi:phospholipid/cholesterol/gamma-HCH transport system substrate-binding protein